MNNVSSQSHILMSCRLTRLAAVVAVTLFGSIGFASAQQNQSPVAVPVPASGVPAAVSAMPTPLPDTSASKDEDPVADTSAEQTPSNDELLEMLRNGNDGKPLTISQMSAVNDMIKRMQFISDIERKMGEMSLGGATAAAVPVGQGLRASGPGGRGGYSVLRIMGAKGNFVATLSDGASQMLVHPGDSVAGGIVTSISLNAVIVRTNGNLQALPFAAPNTNTSGSSTR